MKAGLVFAPLSRISAEYHVAGKQFMVPGDKTRELRAGDLFLTFEEEPHISQELLRLPNAVLLPHIGSASVSTRRNMAVMAAENLLAVLDGREPRHRVA